MKISGAELSQRIGRTHPRLTKYRFAYAEANQLRRKVERVKVYFLLYNPKSGHGIDDFIFYLRGGISPVEWGAYLRTKGVRAYATRWLSAVNEKKRSDWRLVKLVLFHSYNKRSGRRTHSNV